MPSSTGKGRSRGRRGKKSDVKDDFDEIIDVDEDFRRLVARDDGAKDLTALLAEEALKPSDLMRVKAEYEAEGKWAWKRSGQNARVHSLVAHADAAEEFRRNGFDFHADPKPRATGICEWRGRDADGNTWWCNNCAVVHGRTGASFTRCAYHVPNCIASHPGGPVPLECPNNSGLCTTHYKAEHGHDPVPFENGYYVPGVVFARPGTPSHPMAPHHRLHDGPGLKRRMLEGHFKLPASDPSSGSADSTSAGGVFTRYAERKSQAVAGAYRRLIGADVLPPAAAATKIQSMLRMWMAQRTAERVRRERLITLRVRSAVTAQRMTRGHLTRLYIRRRLVLMDRSARTLQRWWRVAHFEMLKRRLGVLRAAAVRMQRWWRLRVMALNLRLLKVRINARDSGMLREEAIFTVRQMVRKFVFRANLRRGFAAAAFRRGVATRLQAMWRVWLAKAAARRLRAGRDARLAVVPSLQKLQRHFRGYQTRLAARAVRHALLEAAGTMNRAARGWMGRKRARRVRGAKEEARRKRLASRRDAAQEEVTGPPDYARMFGLDMSKLVRQTKYTAVSATVNKEANETADVIDRMCEALRRADPGRLGRLPSRTFRTTLASAGVSHTAEQVHRLLRLFPCGVGGCVNTRTYAAFARKQRRRCALHDLVVCPACVYQGRCSSEECGCARYAKEGLGATTGGTARELTSAMHSEMCACGHHKRRHWPEMDHSASIAAAHSSKDTFSGSVLAAAVRRNSAVQAAAGGSSLPVPSSLSSTSSVTAPPGRSSLRRSSLGLLTDHETDRGRRRGSVCSLASAGSLLSPTARSSSVSYRARGSSSGGAGHSGSSSSPGVSALPSLRTSFVGIVGSPSADEVCDAADGLAGGSSFASGLDADGSSGVDGLDGGYSASCESRLDGGGSAAGASVFSGTSASRRRGSVSARAQMRRGSLEHVSRYVPDGTQLTLESADIAAAAKAEEDSLTAEELRRKKAKVPMPAGVGEPETVDVVQCFGGGVLGRVEPTDAMTLTVLGTLWAEEGLEAKRQEVSGRLTGVVTAEMRAAAAARRRGSVGSDGGATRGPGGNLVSAADRQAQELLESLADRARLPLNSVRSANAALATLSSTVSGNTAAANASASAAVREAMLSAYADEDARAIAFNKRLSATRDELRGPAAADGSGGGRALSEADLTRTAVTRRRDSLSLVHMVHSMENDQRYGTTTQEGYAAPIPALSVSVAAVRSLASGLAASADADSGSYSAPSDLHTTSAPYASAWSGLFRKPAGGASFGMPSAHLSLVGAVGINSPYTSSRYSGFNDGSASGSRASGSRASGSRASGARRSSRGATRSSAVDSVASELKSTTASVLVTAEQRTAAADCRRYLHILAAFAGPAMFAGASGMAGNAFSSIAGSTMASKLGVSGYSAGGAAVGALASQLSSTTAEELAAAALNEQVGIDIVADPNRAVSLCFANQHFLRHYWVQLVEDVRLGKIVGGPPGLSRTQRAVAGSGMKADPGRARLLETLLASLGFKRPPGPAANASTSPAKRKGVRSIASAGDGVIRSPYGTLRLGSKVLYIDTPPSQAIEGFPAACRDPESPTGRGGDRTRSPRRVGFAEALSVSRYSGPRVEASEGAESAAGLPPEMDLTRYSFHQVGGAKPLACKVPGCNARFANAALAVEHASGHRRAPAVKSIVPADAELARVWRSDLGLSVWDPPPAAQ